MDDLERVFAALRPTVEVVDGTSVARFFPQPEHRGNPGWLHGGMAATVLDHVLARCASRALGGRVVTGTLDLRYRQPVPLDGGPFVVEARAEPPRHRMVRVSGAIIDDRARALVEAKSMFVTRPLSSRG